MLLPLSTSSLTNPSACLSPPTHPYSKFSWQRSPGFLSINRYLLGGQEIRNTDPPPPCGPTLIDFYMPDNDRHLSGLNCFANDSGRSLMEDDVDVAPQQVRQDKGDVLTDSESDDDNGYVAELPSILRARKIFREDASLPTDDTNPLSPAHFTISLESDGFGMLSPTKRREEQVELLRDRKMLDLESSLIRARQEHEKAISLRFVYACWVSPLINTNDISLHLAPSPTDSRQYQNRVNVSYLHRPYKFRFSTMKKRLGRQET